MVFDTFSSKEHEIMTGTVMRIDPRDGAMTIRVGNGNDKTDALLSASEQIRGEAFHEGDYIRVYVVEVRRNNRGPQVIVSRTHPGLVKRLFELEVPEIASGIVEVKSVAREAGSRSKLAVYAADPTIDAVGACVGPRGGRVGAVVEELKGEKMDIVNWSEDPAQFVAAALSPADVVSVTLIPGQKACRVVVPDDQLSLAIGKEGQNARLAARLTGYKIDIKSVSADRDDPLVLPEMLEEDDEDVILLDEENDEIVETAEAVETAETEEAVETAEVVEADEAPVAEE
jgi:N utilization substance protein A